MKWYNRDKFRLTGHNDPDTENRVLIWLLGGMLVFGLFYILGFYF